MAESIGLAAVLDTGNFTKGLGVYTSGIAQMTSKTTSVASQISGQFVGLGQGVLKFGAVAGGAALVGVAALSAGLIALGGVALNEYAKYERLSLSIQSLVAREISQGQVVEQQRTSLAQLTKKETDELSSLNLKIQEEALERQTMVARIQEQKQRLIDLTVAYGENGLNVQTAKGRLAEMEFELTKSDAATAKMTARINELNAKNGQMVTTLEKVRVGQMSMADAMTQAGPRAQELLKWIQLLAIQSPFTQEGIADAFRTALAYGFTSEAAQRLTQAEVDFAAATGKGVEATNLIALALGQMQAKGKVSGQEIIQLTNAGIGVNAILSEMGFTLDDVSKGLVSSDKFIEAVIKDMEVFKGAGKAQAATFSGLISTLSDLKAVGLREFFTGTFQAVQPYLANFVDWLTKISLETGGLKAIGDVLGSNVAGALRTISGLVGSLQAGGAIGLLGALGITPAAVTLFYQVKTALAEMGQTISTTLGPSLAGISGPVDILNRGIILLSQNFEAFKGALAGIGVMLAVGVFAALVAGLLSLLTPINLIIAGAALLGAAWAGNWGNIQGITQQALATITGLFNTYWPQIAAVTLTAFEIIRSVFAGIVTALQPAVANIQTAFSNLTQALANVGLTWSDVGNALLTATGYVAAGIGTALLGVISVVTGFITGLSSAIATGTQIFSELTLLWQQNLGNIEMVITGVVTIIQGIMQGTWSDIWTGAGMVLQGFILGVIGGMATLVIALTAPLRTVYSFMQGFVTGIADFWRGLFQTLVGGSIIPDMVTAIITWFNTLAAPVMAVFDQLVTGITNVLGTVFGALSGGGGGQIFNTQAMIEGLLLVQQQVTLLNTTIGNIYLLTIPALSAATLMLSMTWIAQVLLMQQQVIMLDTAVQSIYFVTLPMLMTILAATGALWIQQTLAMQQQTIILDQTVQSIYLVTLPTLQATIMATGAITTSVAQAMVTAIQSVITSITSLIGVTNAATAAFTSLGNTAQRIGSEIKSKMNDAAGGIDNLTEAIQEAIEAFDDMEKSARAAAEAAAEAGSASGAAGGVGFHRGIGFARGTLSAATLKPAGGALGLGATIPPGYSNDSFGPMYAQSGEQMLITPRGMSIESLIFQRLADMLGSSVAGGSVSGKVVNVNISVGSINNGMDLATLGAFVRREVAGAFG